MSDALNAHQEEREQNMRRTLGRRTHARMTLGRTRSCSLSCPASSPRAPPSQVFSCGLHSSEEEQLIRDTECRPHEDEAEEDAREEDIWEDDAWEEDTWEEDAWEENTWVHPPPMI